MTGFQPGDSVVVHTALRGTWEWLPAVIVEEVSPAWYRGTIEQWFNVRVAGISITIDARISYLRSPEAHARMLLTA